MAMSNGVTGGVFATLEDLQASKPRVDTIVQLTNGAKYKVVDSDTGANLPFSNGNFAEPLEPVTPFHFGAVGDGVTDDTAAINKAKDYNSKQVHTLDSQFSFSGASTALSGNYEGTGNINTSDGKRGNSVLRLTEAPSPLANGGGLNSFYNNPFPFKSNYDIYVSGEDTVGNPASGYVQYDQTSPFFYGALFSSGHNESTTTADGRTGWAIQRTRLTANGDGDQFCQNWNVVITNNNPLHTGLFGKPAAGLWNGNMTAAVNNVYFNPVEYNLEDNGFDVRSAGLVVNHKRDNNTSAFGEWWCGTRHQATGTVSPDAAFQAAGTWNLVFDATPATGTENVYAQSEGQKMHFDAVVKDVNGAKTYADTFNGSYQWVTAGVYQLFHKNTLVHSVDNTISKHPNKITVVDGLATKARSETTSQVLTALDSCVFIDATATNPTYTLPLSTAYGGAAGRITLKRTGAGGTVTIQRQGADNIIDKSGATVTSFNLGANQAVELVCDENNNWHILYIQ